MLVFLCHRDIGTVWKQFNRLHLAKVIDLNAVKSLCVNRVQTKVKLRT